MKHVAQSQETRAMPLSIARGVSPRQGPDGRESAEFISKHPAATQSNGLWRRQMLVRPLADAEGGGG